MATGCASMARGGRRCPGQTWPASAAADPGHAPRECTRCSWANRIGHQRGKWARCCSMASAGELDPLQPAPPISWRVPRAHRVLLVLPAARSWYQGEAWPRAAPRWPGAAGAVQGAPGQQLLIPLAYQVLQNGGPLPAWCVADPFPFGAWPVPADAVAMAIPCCGRRRRSGASTASSPGAAGLAGSPDPVPGGDVATGCASMARGGRRCPGQTWPASAAADPGHAPRECTRCSWANRIGHQRGKWARCCSMASAGELDPLQPAPPIG